MPTRALSADRPPERQHAWLRRRGRKGGVLMAGEELATVAARALDLALGAAKRDGSPDVEVKVDVRRHASANVRFARNEPTTSGETDEITVSTWIAVGDRHAAASINQTDDQSLVAVAERALAMAKLAPRDPEKMPVL